MSSSVYSVVELIGSSPEGWAQATANAVTEAAGTLGADLRIAEVVEQDVLIDGGRIVAFRSKVRLSYKPGPAPPAGRPEGLSRWVDLALDLRLRQDPATTGVLVTQQARRAARSSPTSPTRSTDGVVRVSVTTDRAKTANLRRDPRASLYVSRDDFWAYAVLEGTAELQPVTAAPDDATVEELVVLYRTVRGEDHPDWAEFRRAMVAERRLVARLRVTHAYGMTGR